MLLFPLPVASRCCSFCCCCSRDEVENDDICEDNSDELILLPSESSEPSLPVAFFLILKHSSFFVSCRFGEGDKLFVDVCCAFVVDVVLFG